MRLSIAHLQPRRRGIVLVFVALALVALLGVLAIALDGGMLQENRRRVKATADAAAMAAAGTLFYNYAALTTTLPAVYDPSGQAAAAARAIAKDNGFRDDGRTAKVEVNIPPKSGPFGGKVGYVEVIVTYFQPRYFSTIWGKTSLEVRVRSVALGRSGGSGTGVLVLDPNKQHALDASGNAALTVAGGASMIVNSDDNAAGRATGGGKITAAHFRITGNYVGTLSGPVATGASPAPDPLRYLPAPAVPPDGVMTVTNLPKGNKRYTLSPGRYSDLPNFKPGDQVVLQQASANSTGGIFYIDGGGLKSTGASITMDSQTTGGVMIYNNPQSHAQSNQISISGNESGTVNLAPLTSGPYAGIVFFQERTSTMPLSISGNGAFDVKGTFYAPNAELHVAGNGNVTIGSQYISRSVNVSGNGNILIDYSDDYTGRGREVSLVE